MIPEPQVKNLGQRKQARPWN